MSIEQDIKDLRDAVDLLKTNDLHTLSREVWQIKGGMAVLILLNLGILLKAFI
ncbi:hypothetical protein LCGC14_0458120 [marine sediment metagenome]|uniref:Uncharacterized protein n=1 Tax=marine sediment metagenome TaxID=412755 RepID=A0A0F9SLA3_9ZZZZ